MIVMLIRKKKTFCGKAKKTTALIALITFFIYTAQERKANEEALPREIIEQIETTVTQCLQKSVLRMYYE
jgi:hypothetical protein